MLRLWAQVQQEDPLGGLTKTLAAAGQIVQDLVALEAEDFSTVLIILTHITHIQLVRTGAVFVTASVFLVERVLQVIQPGKRNQH